MTEGEARAMLSGSPVSSPMPELRGSGNNHPSLLVVSTISATIRAFLIPYAVHLRKIGWRVEAAASGASTDPQLGGAFDRLHDIPLSRSILDLGGILRSARAIRGLLDLGFDIVHVHTPIAAFVTRGAIRSMPSRSRPAAVYTAHGFKFYPGANPAENALFVTAEKLAGRWTDRLVVMNEVDHAAALKYRIVPRRRLILMPGIGVDTQRYSRASVAPEDIARVRTRLAIPAGAPLFVVVGELSRRKRPFDVVAALGLMKNRDGHLVVVGDGPERGRVERAVRVAGVDDRVHFAGIVEDVRPMVAASTALVLASTMEGLPRCLMEALSLEVPVVTTDARGSPDLVAPDAGLVVPVGDVSALARAMDRILDEPGRARTMALRGRERMVRRHELSILIARHEALYSDVLAERTARVGRG